MTAQRDWLRFRGWRNAYWREDAIRARCAHVSLPWAVDGLCICADCGATVGRTGTWTGSANTTLHVNWSGPHATSGTR